MKMDMLKLYANILGLENLPNGKNQANASSYVMIY